MKFHCSHCNQRVNAEPNLFGQTVNCPNCTEPIIIPTPIPKEIPEEAKEQPTIQERPPKPPQKQPTPPPSSITKTYRGTAEQAQRSRIGDVEKLNKAGYFLSSESWAPGEWGCLTFCVALALCIIFIGILIFIYLLIVKPPGLLTVTYQYNEDADSYNVRTCPMCAETIKRTAKICKHCSHPL